MTDVGRVALAARVFTVAALTSLAAVAGPRYFDGALLVVLTAAIAEAVAMIGRVPEHTVAVFEGGVIAALAVLARPDQATVTPYLVIPVLIGAVDLGRAGMLRVIGAEFVVLVATSAIVIQGWDRQFAASGFTWLACGSRDRADGDRPATGHDLLRRRRQLSQRRRADPAPGGPLRQAQRGSGRRGHRRAGHGRRRQRGADAQRRGLRAVSQWRDGAAALLRRHASRRDALGWGAGGQVLGVRGDGAAGDPRRDPAPRERRDDRGAGPRDARQRRVHGGRRAARPSRPARRAAPGSAAVRAGA